MNCLRIALVTPVCATADGGGVATHVQCVGTALASAGHEVLILSARTPASPAGNAVAGLPVQWLEKTPADTFHPLFWHESTRRFNELQVARPFHLVLSEGTCAWGILQLPQRPPLAALMHQFKPIHAFNSALEIDGLRAAASYALRTIPCIIRDSLGQELPFLRKAEAVFSGARHMADKLIRFYRLNPNRVHVVPNWVSVDRFRSSASKRSAGRERWGFPEDSFVTLVFGRLQKTKGVEVALRAFAGTLSRYPGNIFVIGGGGEPAYEEHLKNLAHRLGIAPLCRFLGRVDDAILPELYSAVDVFVMPSLILEVLPYTLLEAMAAGLAIVVADRPGNREALGEAGLFVKAGNDAALGEALLRLRNDNTLCRELGNKALSRALSEYDALKWEHCYNEVVQRMVAEGVHS